MRRTVFISFAVLLLLALSQTQIPSAHSASLPSSAVALSGTRYVPLTIKIVFIGFQATDINTTYLTSRINLPAQKSESILESYQGSGAVIFNFTYQESFVNATDFALYLASIGKPLTTLAGKSNLTNPPENLYFNDSTTDIGTVDNTFYDAGKVEAWLNNATRFGPSPVPGYTLFVADLSSYPSYVPSFTYSEYQAYSTRCALPVNCSDPNRGTAHVHYYNTTVTDPDLGLNQPDPFMTGWGGDNRSYFIDLSAGPSYLTLEQPLQVAQQVRGVNAQPYLLNWRTQFVTDYIAGAVYNLFGPDQLYPVSYSAKYVFDLFVVDARSPSEILNGPNITSTVNLPLIRSQLDSLVPFATVTVNPKFLNLTSSPGLLKIVTDATTTIHDPLANDTIVDAKPVYNWLSVENHVAQFVNATRTSDEIDIPEFIFAFSGDHDFGFTYKGDVLLGKSDSIYGVSLGDMVLISHSQRDFIMGSGYIGTGYPQPGRGIGFTRTIVHESGHELGLVHPFDYDIDEDFVNSVMAYYPNVNGYSQFDRDLELRGINDELLLYAQVTLAGTSSSLFNAASIAAARQAMGTAEAKYSGMDYAGAVAFSLSAARNAAAAQQGSGLFSTFGATILFLVVGILVGAAIGLVVGFLVFRRRASGGLAYNRCPTCNRPLRWDPALMRWYCDFCQKPV